MKKILLIIVFILTITTPLTFAGISGEIGSIGSKTTNNREPLDLIELMSSKGCKNIKNDSGNGFEYAECMLDNGLISQISQRISENGDAEYIVIEGKLKNNMYIKADGSILLDGKKVEVETKETQSIGDVTPQVVNSYTCSVNPLIGTYGDYSIYVKTTKKNVYLGQAIETITLGAFCALISTLHPAFKIGTTIGTSLYALMLATQPNGTAMSISYKTHKYKTALTGMIAERYITKYYAKPNQVTYLETKISYGLTIL